MTKGQATKRFLAAMGFIAVIHIGFFFWTLSWGLSNPLNGPGLVWAIASMFVLIPAMFWNIGRFISELSGAKRGA